MSIGLSWKWITVPTSNHCACLKRNTVSPKPVLVRLQKRMAGPATSAKVKARAQAKLDASLLDKKLDSKRKITEKEVIEVAAETQKNIILNHRKDIARGRAVAMQLLGELEDQTDKWPDLEELGVLLCNPDKSGKDRLNDIYHAIIGHPGRVDSMKKLADTLKTLITSEREAFGIESKTPFDDALKASGIQVSFVAASHAN